MKFGLSSLFLVIIAGATISSSVSGGSWAGYIGSVLVFSFAISIYFAAEKKDRFETAFAWITVANLLASISYIVTSGLTEYFQSPSNSAVSMASSVAACLFAGAIGGVLLLPLSLGVMLLTWSLRESLKEKQII